MTAATVAILALADATIPGGRETLVNDLAEMIADRRYYSPEHVAEMLDVSLSCIKTWRRTGILTPSLKIPGGTARYTLADINKALQANGGKELNRGDA